MSETCVLGSVFGPSWAQLHTYTHALSVYRKDLQTQRMAAIVASFLSCPSSGFFIRLPLPFTCCWAFAAVFFCIEVGVAEFCAFASLTFDDAMLCLHPLRLGFLQLLFSVIPCNPAHGCLHSSVGQSARLVSVRSRVRTSVEAMNFSFCYSAVL
jgi:hypothetical protein